MKALTEKEKKQRKLMLMIPVLALPFLFLLFWSLGGGLSASGQTEKPSAGLNTNLPEPDLDQNEQADKLSMYRKATDDSLKLQEQIRNDPYYAQPASDTDTGYASTGTDPFNDARFAATGDANIDAINARLVKLHAQVNEPQSQEYLPPAPTSDIDRMQQMLRTMDGSNADPEMAQLEGMLDKILDIQNPQRARERIRDQSLKNRKQVYTVSSRTEKNPVSDIRERNTGARSSNDFYDWSASTYADEEQPAVSAIVQQSATVVTGATLKLRLTDDVFIKGKLIPKGTFVYGTCALNGDRLQIALTSIRHNNALYPVNLVAYDMDGIAGIYMPGAISRDVAKNSAQEAIQSVDYYNVDNSAASQAAGVGIQAAKSLFTKKAKLIKVTVRAGYKLLLKDANSNE